MALRKLQNILFYLPGFHLKRRERKHISSLLFDRKNGVIMDWTEKAGCTVSIRMFFRHMGVLDEAVSYSRWIHRYRMQKFYSDHPVTLQDVLSRTNVLFKVVRNPFTRAVSSFLHILRNPQLAVPVREKLELQDLQTLTFRRFVSFLEIEDLRLCNGHYRLQTKAYERLDLRHPHVCQIEHLAHHINTLNEHYGFHFRTDDTHSAHHVVKDTTACRPAPDIPARDLSGNPPSYRFFYDTKLIEQVSRLYAEDLEAYGYSYPWEPAS